MDFASVNNNIMDQARFMAGNRPVDRIDLSLLSSDDAALLNAAKEFETYFIQMMFRSMRNTVDTERGVLPPNNMENIFRDMLDEQFARNAVESGVGLGLAQQIFRQMTSQRNPIQDSLVYEGTYGAAVDTPDEM